MTGSAWPATIDSGRPSAEEVGGEKPLYLLGCPTLSDDLAQLAEFGDQRPLLAHERQAIHSAVYVCAARIRRARPAAMAAQLEGRWDGK